MGTGNRSRKSVLLCGTALALSAMFVATGADGARAQEISAIGADVPSDAQLFLEADTVTYDSDRSVVTAAGGVQIDYGDYKVVARNLVYDQKTRRLMVSGDVELQQPDGNRIYADQLDLTDDFRDGFVQALRIETPDNTRFAAASATRADGSVTTFDRGVYTACEACEENPDRPPLWQVKARKIVWDQEAKEIRYYGAQFEFFGAPIAYLPYFQSADPTVKRKSGFLAPSFKSGSDLGYGLRVPYFYALSDDKDFTVAGTYYTKQGFLGEIEYRQAFENGIITLQAAGISQQDRFAFDGDNIVQNGQIIGESPDYANTDRGMVGTKGRFALSEQWVFGWEWLFQSDDNFSNTYDIPGFSDTIHTSEVYLTGLGDQSFFDLRMQEFDYQSTDPLLDDRQPFVRPRFDYERIEQESVLGGEVTFNMNVVSLEREADDLTLICDTTSAIDDGVRQSCVIPNNGYQFNPFFTRHNGLEGDYSRGSADLRWSDVYTLPSGLVLTPTAGLRGDLYTADMQSAGFTNPLYANGNLIDSILNQGAEDIDISGTRGMATAALEARYPYLIQVGGVSHVIEPIAQVIARNDEQDIGLIPNEDSGTFVFNATNLFDLNKFSGYDRIEGGHRANVGLRYSGDLGNDWVVNAVAGQSYHLGGRNSFDEVDLTLVGFNSGLEKDISDYVGLVSLQTPYGLTVGAQGRYDEEDLSLERLDVFSEVSFERVTASVSYSNIAAQPIYGSLDDRSQATASGSLQFAENWTAFAGASYDIENGALIDQNYGIRYADECFSLLVGYRERTDRYSLESDEQTFTFNVGLRTIAEFGQSLNAGGF
ncbi:LPS-assembly protein LptD [Fulvimarina sp. 2208YS6-2-32]|uniref:LPS-assembly protein LptD n=1 Tax=Fulvimarina uroteuthidis TaxID=3098149 RepID=A0ABU5I502_9HYPH|nr:LPS-assembly protein LptD [Fulvimarina sp. 2208YS6-2-32]MDY8110465.1 LPS-assembly protein LptD [Fulvimarina sp. 2208YS6-2-32]